MRSLVLVFLFLAGSFAAAQPAPDLLCISENESNYYAVTLLDSDQMNVRARRIGEETVDRKYVIRHSQDEDVMNFELFDDQGEIQFLLSLKNSIVRLIDYARIGDDSITCYAGRDAL